MITKLKGYLETKEGEILGVASTEAPDRDGEVIKATGWDLKNFKKNPVILASHKWHEFPIGKATGIAIEKGKLMFKMILSEATEEARNAKQLVEEGILNSFSVGFVARERDEKNNNVITESELLEISLVSIPANPQAVVTAKSMNENEMADEVYNNFKHLLKDVENKSSSQIGDDQIKGEDGAGRKIDVTAQLMRSVKKATGDLQNLCKELKEKGGAEK